MKLFDIKCPKCNCDEFIITDTYDYDDNSDIMHYMFRNHCICKECNKVFYFVAHYKLDRYDELCD